MELDGSESKWCLKVDAYKIFIYPLGEMSHIAMLHLNCRGLCLLKFLFEINLNQITINSLGKGATCSETARWLLGEKSSCLVIQLILSSKVRFWFVKGITLQQRNSRALTEGTFAALIAKEWNVLATETNTLLILNIDFAIENKTQTQ